MSKLMLKRTFWAFLVLTLLTSMAMLVIDNGLKSATSPNGIISFEFCGFTASCDAALLEWGVKGQALAMLSLGLDYLFMILYPGLLCLGLLLLAPRVPRGLYRMTVIAACLCPAISLADAAENYALIQIILNGSGSTYGLLASTFATIKFVILGVTLAWLLFTSMRYVVFKRSDA